VFDTNLLDQSVRLLGHVSDQDLPVLMQSAEMLVFPSLHEGFGLPVIEAMALGVPVVTSNAAALPEVAGDAALLVNPSDVDEIASAMRRILEDRSLADDLRIRGRARARGFRWETTCAELVSLCEGLVCGNAPRAEPVTP
jgi:glycosyltransferase involved in cell wall biosynthesis